LETFYQQVIEKRLQQHQRSMILHRLTSRTKTLIVSSRNSLNGIDLPINPMISEDDEDATKGLKRLLVMYGCAETPGTAAKSTVTLDCSRSSGGSIKRYSSKRWGPADMICRQDVF
jgi:hypothetical protein